MPRIPDEALARWIPHLVRVWRDGRGGPPPGRGPARGRHQGQRFPPRGEPRSRGGAGDLLGPDELREVGAAVARLSKGLTRERELAGARYLDEGRLLGAYLLFYWPVSYLQARGILSELPRRPRTVLDLGSGPAPVAFAALDAGAAEVVAAARSARALAAARALAVAAGEPIATREWNPSRGAPLAELAGGRRFDLVTMGHVVNELFPGPDADARRASSAGRAPRSSARPTGATRSGPSSRRRSSRRSARPPACARRR